MGHLDGLVLFLDLLGAADADRDVDHHVAPPCAAFSSIQCCREAAPFVTRGSYCRAAPRSCQAGAWRSPGKLARKSVEARDMPRCPSAPSRNTIDVTTFWPFSSLADVALTVVVPQATRAVPSSRSWTFARPALPVVAALLRSGEGEGLTDAIEQRRPRVNEKPLVLAVNA